MRFSIITPVFNSAGSIRGCVRSVLSQTFTDFEHIIVDNLSGDGTLDIIREEHANAGRETVLLVISEADRGISDAFNKGIAAARGEILLILNADDELYNESVLKCADANMSSAEILFMHGDMLFLDEHFGTNRRAPLLCPIWEAMPFNHPGMFVRRAVYEKYGGFLLDYKVAMDYEIILRLEKSIPDFRSRGKYFNGFPLTKTRAGGASWKNEILGIKEVRKALENHGAWNAAAALAYYKRLLRTKVKHLLDALGLRSLVQVWRKWKWRRSRIV